MSTLYELTEEMMALSEMMEDSETDEQVLLDTIEGVSGEYDAKIENYCKLIKNLDAESKALKEESKRLSARQKTIDGNISRLKAFMLESMRQVGKTEAGGLLKAKIAKNGGMLPLKVNVQPEELPEEYRRTVYETDNEAIRKALDEGKELDFAEYGERGESLRIK